MSDRSPSELGGTLNIGSNLLAHHRQVLEEAGLVERLSSAGNARRKYLRLLPEALHPLLDLSLPSWPATF
jgi:DNA-binding MarR family transcriptional regulator